MLPAFPPAPMASIGAPSNVGGRKANGEHPKVGGTLLGFCQKSAVRYSCQAR